VRAPAVTDRHSMNSVNFCYQLLREIADVEWLAPGTNRENLRSQEGALLSAAALAMLEIFSDSLHCADCDMCDAFGALLPGAQLTSRMY
jgi:hypothetical protein